MKILIINSGSSSLKAALYEAKNLQKIMQAHIDGISEKSCRFTFKGNGKNIGQHMPVKNHEEGVKLVLDTLVKTETAANLKEILAIGHRVVHGGEKYSASVQIDNKVLGAIEKLSNLAPLHNPANLDSIKACKKLLPKAKNFAIFDTAFHQTMPEKAYIYALPEKFYKDDHIRRYGFHGTSHKYVINYLIKKLKLKNLKIVSCHLGNGSSITATINGKSVDTSMGFTPLEGIMMGTRSGSIDPAITFHLQNNLKMKPAQVDHLLNHESGLLAVSAVSHDMREIYEQSRKGNQKAKFTIEMLAYQIAKYIGSYAAAINGLNAIIFTGGMAERAFYLREQVCEYLEFLGLKLDKKRNEKTIKPPFDSKDEEISDKKSKVKVFVIETDEEKQIASEVKDLL